MSERDKWENTNNIHLYGDEAAHDYLFVTRFKEGYPDKADIERMQDEMEARITQNLTNGWFVGHMTHATDGYLHYFKVAIRRDV